MANSNPVLLYQPEKLNFEKMKKMTRDIIILHHVYHKWRSYDVWFLRYWVWRTEFFVILDHFLPFYPLTTWKIKYNFTNVYHKWQSYDVWFLRYEAWWIEFFCYFGLVFALLPLKIKILKNWKIHLKISPFYTSVPKIMIIYCSWDMVHNG